MATNPYAGLTQQQLMEYLMSLLAPAQGTGLLPSTETKFLSNLVKDYGKQATPTFKEIYNPYLEMYSNPSDPASSIMLDAFDRVEQGFVPEEIENDLITQGISLTPSQRAHLEGYASSVSKRNEAVAERQFGQENVASEYGLPSPLQGWGLDPELVAAIYTRQKTGLTDKEAMQKAADAAMKEYVKSAIIPLDRARKMAAAKRASELSSEDANLLAAQEFEKTSMFYPSDRRQPERQTAKVLPAEEKRKINQGLKKEALKIYSQSVKDAEAGRGGNSSILSSTRVLQGMAEDQARFEQALANKIIEQLTGGGTPYDVAVKQAQNYLAKR